MKVNNGRVTEAVIIDIIFQERLTSIFVVSFKDVLFKDVLIIWVVWLINVILPLPSMCSFVVGRMVMEGLVLGSSVLVLGDSFFFSSFDCSTLERRLPVVVVVAVEMCS